MHWPNATDGYSVLELTLIVRRRNNRSVDRQDIEPGTILAAVVPQLDNVTLAKLVEHFRQLIMVLPLRHCKTINYRSFEWRLGWIS